MRVLARVVALLLLGSSLLQCTEAGRPSDPSEISVIVFGSCADEKLDQPFWNPVLELNPDLVLLMGDNIYADTEDPAVFASKYAQLAGNPGFRDVRNRIPLMATWDDHDFGLNDGGAEFLGKEIAKDAFLTFFEIPEDHEMRQREGIYQSKVFGSEGQRVQVIMLDTRYFRDPLTPRSDSVSYAHPGRYVPSLDSSLTTLGDEQWLWLEKQLRVPAEIRLLVSSIQVIPDEHGWEKWGNHPHERKRLFALLEKTEAEGVIILSGDRHLAELSQLSVDETDSPGYGLIEATSSGLNRGGGGSADEPNRHRIGENFRDNNFGILKIDWTHADPGIRIEIRNDKNELGLEYSVHLSELKSADS